MKLLQLYIQGQRVDLFKDESVTLTDSIQNVKDIEKIFTSFSQSFSVPASKTNNKIFKHYYNYDITNTFDARVKVEARIEINYQTFKTGKIKLEGVDLKNNKPHTYRITFFGDIVDLKDKLGERKLNSLDNLSSLNLNYDWIKVYDKLTEDPTTTDIIAPLITHTQRLYYDSVTHLNADDGNLYYHSQFDYHGVHWNELKYAIRVNRLIEAIEDQYDLQFSTDFFKNASVEEMNNMFMWLHRKSGKVEDLSGGTESTELVTGWTDVYREVYEMTDSALTIYGDPQFFTTLKLDIVPASQSDTYGVIVQLFGDTVYENLNVQGSLLNIDLLPTIIAAGIEYQVYIVSTGVVAFNNIKWTVAYYEYDPYGAYSYYDTFSNSTFATSGIFVFNINRQMPDIKIIDFLSGLFKLFNLTAYVENGVIVVKKLDDFYASSTTEWDITKHVDQKKSNVNAALPYREIIFKFKDTKYFLAEKFNQLNNKNWGELLYNQGRTDLAGGLYKVEVPFGHMLYEKLKDAGTGEPKNIQYGYCVNESQSSYLGAPLMFYPIRVNTGGISFINSFDNDGEPDGKTNVVNANLPFNSVSLNSSTNNFNLNFYPEFSEWTTDSTFTGTLFQNYYRNYIVNTFSLKQRITKVTAYLPQSILMNYNLADIFILNGNKYRINKITTNLLTNKSDIELLNEI